MGLSGHRATEANVGNRGNRASGGTNQTARRFPSLAVMHLKIFADTEEAKDDEMPASARLEAAPSRGGWTLFGRLLVWATRNNH